MQLSKYKKNTIFAMACGLVTVLLGIIPVMGRAHSLFAVSTVMVLNTILHYESYIASLIYDKKRKTNVLTMAIVETILLTFFAYSLSHRDWKEFVLLFAVYLVFNGTSLLAASTSFVRCCGILTAALGAILYFLGRQPGPIAGAFIGLNLIVNGAERIILSARNGAYTAGEQSGETDGQHSDAPSDR